MIDHLKSGIGTPLKKDNISEIYIFELFDKEFNGSLSTRQWGIRYPNATMKYKIDFNGGSRIGEGRWRKELKEEDDDGELNKGNIVISPFNGHSNVFYPI